MLPWPVPSSPSQGPCQGSAFSPEHPSGFLATVHLLWSFQGYPTKYTQGNTLHCFECSRRHFCRCPLRLHPAWGSIFSQAPCQLQGEGRVLIFLFLLKKKKKRQGLVILPRLPLSSWAQVTLLPWPRQQLGPQALCGGTCIVGYPFQWARATSHILGQTQDWIHGAWGGGCVTLSEKKLQE